MTDLIATKSMKYATRRLQAEDRFTVKSKRDARILVGIGNARVAEPEKDDIADLRAEYAEKFDKKPFNGWNADTLREKIADA